MRTAQTGGRLAPTHPCLEARIRYHATAAFATVGGQNNGRSARTRRASRLRYATAGRVASRASRPGGCGPRPGGVPWGDGRGCPPRSHDAPPGARRGRAKCRAGRREPAERATSVMRGATPGAMDDDGGDRIGRAGGASVEVARRAVEHPPRSHGAPSGERRGRTKCRAGRRVPADRATSTGRGPVASSAGRRRAGHGPVGSDRVGTTEVAGHAVGPTSRSHELPCRRLRGGKSCDFGPRPPPGEAGRQPSDWPAAARRTRSTGRPAPPPPGATRRRRAAARAPARSAPRAPAAPSASASARRGARRSRAPRSRRAPRPTPGGRRPSQRVRPARSRR